MRRLTGFLAIFMMLSAAAPLLACMTDRAMSQDESACCRAMHNKCDGMADMGCCRTEARTDKYPQLATAPPTIDLHVAVGERVDPFLFQVQDVQPTLLRLPEEYSPPGLVTARIAVLRV